MKISTNNPAKSTENTKDRYIRAIPIKRKKITNDRQQKEKDELPLAWQVHRL